jgi:hypothetical protein
VEQQGGQCRPAADAQLAEHRLGVVSDGVGRQPRRGGDLCGRQVAHQHLGDLALSGRQLVGRHDEGHHLSAVGRFDEAGAEHRAELVAPAVRGIAGPVAGAAVQFAAGGGRQGERRSGGAGDQGERDEVGAGELVLDEPQVGPGAVTRP